MAKTKTLKNKPPEKEQNDTSSSDQQPTNAKDSTASKKEKINWRRMAMLTLRYQTYQIFPARKIL